MTPYWLEIAGIFMLLLVGGFFVAAEMSLVSASRPLLRARAQAGEKGAAAALKLLDDPGRMLAAVQLGVTLVGFLASAVAAVGLSDVVAGWLASLGTPRSVAHISAVVLTTISVAYVSLVLGELAPKRLGLQRAEAVATAVSAPVDAIAAIFGPVTWFLARSTDVVGRLLGLGTGGKPGVTEEELRLLVTEQGTLLDEEKRMIQEVLELGDTMVREVMVPRVDAVMIDAAMPFPQALQVFRRTGFSRLPVYDGDRDRVVGVLLVKDALPCLAEGRKCDTVRGLARPAVFVPETKSALDLLGEMQATRNQMAIVVDEHGGTEGVVTLEDIIEEIVGEVSDEYDHVQRFLTPLGDDDWLVDGRLPVEEADEGLGMDLPSSDEYETLAGWVLAELGHIPVAGETLRHGDWLVRVANVRRRRVARLRVTREVASDQAPEE